MAALEAERLILLRVGDLASEDGRAPELRKLGDGLKQRAAAWEKAVNARATEIGADIGEVHDLGTRASADLPPVARGPGRPADRDLFLGTVEAEEQGIVDLSRVLADLCQSADRRLVVDALAALEGDLKAARNVAPKTAREFRTSPEETRRAQDLSH
jgi:hypothetical protein